MGKRGKLREKAEYLQRGYYRKIVNERISSPFDCPVCGDRTLKIVKYNAVTVIGTTGWVKLVRGIIKTKDDKVYWYECPCGWKGLTDILPACSGYVDALANIIDKKIIEFVVECGGILS